MISNTLYVVGLLAFAAGTYFDIFVEFKAEHTAHMLDLVGMGLLVGSVLLEMYHTH
jgi:hypothetical protein